MSAAAAVRRARPRKLHRLPAGPLVALVVARGGFRACCSPRLSDVERAALERAFSRGARSGAFTWKVADELAVRLLGMHPLLVWGDEWLGGDRLAHRSA